MQVKGAVIGDGWTDPINQINFFDSMLYSAGIVSNKYRDTATWYQTQSILNIYHKDYKNVLIQLFRPLLFTILSLATKQPRRLTGVAWVFGIFVIINN